MQAANPKPAKKTPAERLIQLIIFRVAFFLYPAKHKQIIAQEKIEPSKIPKMIENCSKREVTL